jgi:hypothetical protein
MDRDLMKDPLGLNNLPTPPVIRAEQVAPAMHIVNLYKRITSNYTADSLETRTVLLAHLVYLAYADLKEHTTK